MTSKITHRISLSALVTGKLEYKCCHFFPPCSCLYKNFTLLPFRIFTYSSSDKLTSSKSQICKVCSKLRIMKSYLPAGYLEFTRVVCGVDTLSFSQFPPWSVSTSRVRRGKAVPVASGFRGLLGGERSTPADTGCVLLGFLFCF